MTNMTENLTKNVVFLFTKNKIKVKNNVFYIKYLNNINNVSTKWLLIFVLF